MSLRWKLVAILSVCVALYTALISLILFLVILPSFSDRELSEGREDLNRLTEQVEREVESVDALCGDWSAWDDMYQFVIEPDPARIAAYEELNLNLLWYRQNQLNLLYVINVKGEVVWGRVYQDPMVTKASPVPVAEFAAEPWPLSNPLLCRPPDWAPHSGVLPTSIGLMMVSCRPIKDSRMQAEPQGTLVMGRLLDDSMTHRICRLAQVRGGLISAGGDLSAIERQALAAGTGGESVVVEKDRQVVRLYTAMNGVLGTPVLVVRADTARDITAGGNGAVLFALMSTLMAAILVFAVVMVLLRWAVVTPLRLLTQHVTGVAAEGKLNLLDIPRRGDELGVLAREFNRMMQRIQEDTNRRQAAEETLRDSQAQVLRAQHLAELGEMGATIAHEVRNPITGISSAMQVLRNSHPVDEARRELMDDMLANVGRVEGIVQRALVFARRWKPAKQPTDLYALTAKVCEEARARRLCDGARLHVEPRGKLVAPADSVLIEQVLWNLLENAVEAVGEVSGPGEIRCRFEETMDAVRIIVEDTGSGISPAAADNLFRPFFTTKTNGTGLGLVVCKKIVEAHGGKITLNGRPGPGTEAVVELPRGT